MSDESRFVRWAWLLANAGFYDDSDELWAFYQAQRRRPDPGRTEAARQAVVMHPRDRSRQHAAFLHLCHALKVDPGNDRTARRYLAAARKENRTSAEMTACPETTCNPELENPDA